MPYEARSTGNGFVVDDGSDALGVTSDERTVTVTGSRLNVPERYVHISDDTVRVASTIGELHDSLAAAGIPVEASPYGLSQMLTHGLVASPDSVYEGVYRIASGDQIEATARNGRIEVDLSHHFEWCYSKSRQDQAPDTARFMSLLADATDRQVRAAGGQGVLCLSSGKDSVAVAVALAQSGNTQVPCVTYIAHEQDTEYLYARDLCERLGLEHHTATMPDDPRIVRDLVTRLFEQGSAPTTDLSIIPSMLLAQQAGFDSGAALLDGTGNDLYAGWLPGRQDRLKRQLRIRNRTLMRAIRSRLPLDSRWNYLTRSALGTQLTLRLFRQEDLPRFYPDAVDVDDRYFELSEPEDDIFEWYCNVVTRVDDTSRTIPKVLLTAEAAGLTGAMPFLDEQVAEYWFNLPETDRVDRTTWGKKLFLKKALKDAIGYDDAAVGTGYFDFDGQRFLLDHADFVRDEVLGCALWGNEIEPLFNEWMDALPDRKMLYHSLHALFIVSGWHNHSRHLSHNAPRSSEASP
ncbi:asparagine synthase-related protein [Actinomycetota bacterium]